MTQNQGIDYGVGKSNIDSETGIRFGVIHHSEVGGAWYEASEADYGPSYCPKCGNAAEPMDKLYTEGFLNSEIEAEYEFYKSDTPEYVCEDCKIIFGSENAFNDEPLGFFIDDGKYKAVQFGDGDIFVEKSPYFTYAQFCSPCAPGAVYLVNPLETPNENNRGYCFGHDWYENGKAPYPVFSVETGEIVKPV